MNYNGSAWDTISRVESFYGIWDSHTSNYYNYSLQAFTLVGDGAFTNDSLGNMIEQKIRYFDGTNWHLQNHKKWEINYDPNGNITDHSQRDYDHGQGSFVNTWRREYGSFFVSSTPNTDLNTRLTVFPNPSSACSTSA